MYFLKLSLLHILLLEFMNRIIIEFMKNKYQKLSSLVDSPFIKHI